MTLMTANALFLKDRLDWSRPHLNWLPTRSYWGLRRNRR